VKTMQQDAAQLLIWQQPHAHERRYELRSGDDTLATLRWEKGCGSLASAASADGQWTFKRVGFLQPRVTVRAFGSDAEVATFHPTWRGDGTLEFRDGRSVRWATTNVWHTEWAFARGGDTFLRFSPRGGLSGLIKHEAQMEIVPAATTFPDLSLLALLGWYLMLLASDDAAGVAAGAVAAVVAAG
jgi:hypothetical protein